ncbi:MAG: hypothetical protein US13_C0004G0083 [candidate division TM6 bacterium GW2011_GWE2_36_25]|nr:MAG: hypothetical protein US03_C0004G0083 [candidate division TM6 bacterium GW2011_GWF2_36_131]KKQ03261.1 MAG: hypothetical protein US13_C0004G0083 [candidate division TM6 bacterium GW2011_GWE2_36_25]KKQ19183.1 MAG: hypothetical protein US32_C0014G0004 [candidate division TM6 bacterium GW2011_GWA2_36_9]
MMKKQWWLLICTTVQLFSYEFKTLEQEVIDLAANSVALDLAQLQRKRTIAKYIIGAGVLGGAAWGLYKWHHDAGDNTNQKNNTCVKLEDRKGELKIPEVPKVGFFSSVGGWIKSGCVDFIKQAPIGLGFAFFSSGATIYAFRMWQAFDQFFRPLNLEWLLKDRLNFYKKIMQLKYTAAVLDPHSSDFSIFKNVTINWSDQFVSVFGNDERQHLAAFDELVRLKLIADRRLTLDKDDVASYEELFVRQWNNLIESVSCCIGFINYRLSNDGDADEFEKNQLIMCRDDMIRATQNIAHVLPSLITRDATHESSGLLGAVYEYTNSMQHLCAILDSNDIVG